VIGRKKNWKFVVMFGAVALLLGSLAAGTAGVAQATLVSEEDHWKYNINKWAWDSELRRTVGMITPQIIIQNETADRLEGYIADANGTRLEMYDEHYLHIRYLSNTSAGSDWELAGKANDGYFAIDIPERYRDAEIIRIYASNNYYRVDNGTPYTPQTQVKINSAILDYRTNSTLAVQTEVAEVEEPQPLRSIYDRGSLIDWVLSRNGLLPVRSSDAGE
jgi:hypothetical protein